MRFFYSTIIVFILSPVLLETKLQLLGMENNFLNSTNQKLKNLEQTLSYLYNFSEFQPLKIFIIYSKPKSMITNVVTRCIANRFINTYRVSVKNFSSKYIWKDEINITWIILIDNSAMLDDLIKCQDKFWKSRSQYLIIFNNSLATIVWQDILYVLWNTYSVYKIIVISAEDDFRCMIRYFPFDRIHDRLGAARKICLIDTKDSHNKVLLQLNNNEEVASRTKYIDNISFSPESIQLFENFEKLNDYPLKVIVFPSLMMRIENEYSSPTFFGLDADVMALLENKMQAKFHINIINKSKDTDPFHAALLALENHNGDFIVTSFFMMIYEGYHQYEFTVGVYEDKLCLIAPAAGLVPKSLMPVQPFSTNLWIILATYNFLITIFWMLISHVSRSFHQSKQILPLPKKPIYNKALSKDPFKSGMKVSDRNRLKITSIQQIDNNRPFHFKIMKIYPYLWAFFELIPLLCYPLSKANTRTQKSLLCGTLFFGITITGLYQSCLVSTLSKPFHYPEIRTLEDVADSNLTIITKYENLKTNTFTADTPLFNTLRGRTKVIHSDKPTNQLIVSNKNVISISRYTSIHLENQTIYYDKEGNFLLHIVDECPATYVLSYVMRFHSPYAERINTLILRMQEAGLIQWWYENTTFLIKIDQKRRTAVNNERKVKLSLEHYSLTFLGLFIGLFGCFLVFLVEVYCFKNIQFKNVIKKYS